MAKFEDLTGQTFGNWTVVEFVSGRSRSTWICKCVCGHTRPVLASSLKRHLSVSCGCSFQQDLRGKKFGALLVLEEDTMYWKGAKKVKAWKCLCDCGETKTVATAHLLHKTNNTVSCGCRIDKIINPRLSSARVAYQGKYKDGDLTFEKFLELTQKDCYYCGCPPSNCANAFAHPSAKARRKRENKFAGEIGNFIYNGLDRVDSSKPHNLDNVVPCCKTCNWAKLNRSVEDFKKWIKQVHEHLFAQKEKDSSCLESSSELALVS